MERAAGRQTPSTRLERIKPLARRSGRWLAALSGGLFWLAASAAQPDAPTLVDCDASSPSRLLLPQAQTAALDARASAVWVGARTLAWPGREAIAGHRYRLYASTSGQLRWRPGESVDGADRVAELQVQPGARLPAAYHYLGSTLLLQRADADGDMSEWFRAQLLLADEDEQGHVQAAATTQLAGALDERFAAEAQTRPLGVSRAGRGDGTQFGLWAPTARQVWLCRQTGPESHATALDAMALDTASGVWRLQLPAWVGGSYYRYMVDVFVPGLGLVRNLVTDPYSISLNADSRRSYVGDLDAPELMPAGWLRHRRPRAASASTQMSIYELHLRDFSWNDRSVPDLRRGKYLAFAEPASLGVQHLRRLAQAGLTDVHLLPVFDIASIPERGCVQPLIPVAAPDSPLQQAAVVEQAARDCYNWGYDPLHYGAPEGSYASDADDAAVRVREFRRMVMALHGLGLRVGMDLVYNHTPASGQAAMSVLDRIVPGYYQRLDAEGRVERSTCCDNTATEHLMMGRLLLDTVQRWARDYGVDSFRFDLMGHQPRALMEQLQVRLRETVGHEVPLIGEGWNFGEVADGRRFVQASQLSLNGSGIGSFSDRGRDALRGGTPGDSSDAGLQRQGWTNGLFYAPNGLAVAQEMEAPTRDALLAAADLVRVGLAGSLRAVRMEDRRGETLALAQIDYAGQPAGFASQPSEVVNYAENHDNHTLYDSNVLRLPRDTSREDRVRVQLLATAVTAYSQGVAYFHAGMELLRSKSLDRNSYDSGDWFNRLDWSLQDNGFAAGLPPAPDNRVNWSLYGPLLADPLLKPTPAQIRQARDMFLDQLRVRASSSLFHLRSADEVQRRLRFFNTGPQQNPALVLVALDGHGLPGANFEGLLLAFNAAPQVQSLVLPELRGQDWRLHPVLASPRAADRRLREEARLDTVRGRLELPGRTAAVFVLR